jgi:hypothetical protein
MSPGPAASANAPPAPPPPPRPLTAAANRRGWTEPVVRFWILATLVLVGIGGWFITKQVIAARNQQWLIANGTPVTATVVSVDNDARIGKKSPPGSSCTLKFDWKDQTINVDGALSSNDFITTGQTVSLHVDPNDTSVWTDRTEPEPLGHLLIAGWVIIPAVTITAAGALLLRRRLLSVWRGSDAALYNVLSVRYSALAPLSHTVSCVVATGRDPTIVTVYLPSRFPRPQPGEVLWLLRRSGNSKSAIAACAFE